MCKKLCHRDDNDTAESQLSVLPPHGSSARSGRTGSSGDHSQHTDIVHLQASQSWTRSTVSADLEIIQTVQFIVTNHIRDD